MALKRILVGSPVCQKPEILNAFLSSLKKLSRSGFLMDYAFVDDNKDAKSSQLLKHFHREDSDLTIFPPHGNGNLMLRVGGFKNQIIKYALEQKYDALFFVDSDLILHPGLVEHLSHAKKDVISEIFWTSRHPGQRLEPNVWLFDEYDLAYRTPGEVLDEETAEKREELFLDSLKVPGIYEVGGLGACTLITREALLKGVDFSYIPNLTIRGEDRFFCIRAAVLGISLFVDTMYPAYHIYHPSDLSGAEAYVEKSSAPAGRNEDKGNRITLSMVIRNTDGRYLERVLTGLKGHIDDAVIIDDASDDHTVKLYEYLLEDIPHRIIRNDKKMFANESELRKTQWIETIKTNPDWILNLDADEVIEPVFWNHADEMTADPQYDAYGFRLYDMWNDQEYREDRFWESHKSSRMFLLRYRPEYPYTWKETTQHCGRFPYNLEQIPRCNSDYRIQHFGWASREDRNEKYDRYRRMDPEAFYGVRGQYDSLLDSYPHLIAW